jgi:gamma-glutamyl hercynylcysteine S-oxide synthase
MAEHTLMRPEVTELIDMLRETREQTLRLIAPVSERDLTVQHDPLMSPVIWDLGHIAHFEELWLNRNIDGHVEFVEMPGLFNPFENPRRVRGQLALPNVAETLAILDEIRHRVLEKLETVDFSSVDPMLTDGYIVRMVAQHEHQHTETILQTMQLKGGEPYRAPRQDVAFDRPIAIDDRAMVHVPRGVVPIGTDDHTAAYDNERPRHLVALASFWIDVAPVTNGAYVEFIEAGGYQRRELWTDAGWAWRTADGATAPKYWQRVGGEWHGRFFDRSAPVDPRRPVCHVTYHEAEAFARWAGKRLPTEYEWEAAASWDPRSGTTRAYPWGDRPPTPKDANVGQLVFEPMPVGTYPRNVSPLGCYGMIGDVWEWTSTDFNGYPGYESFPYKEYSEVFFGNEYKVLRGGSFATRVGAIRNTFRNWDYQIRRQIFSGFRCARND